MFVKVLLASIGASLLGTAAVNAAACPHMLQRRATIGLEVNRFITQQQDSKSTSHPASAVDWSALESDLVALFTQSQPYWPADFGNYGPFFIRLAWHCAGSYRTSDGRGGCDGGRIRFAPESNWADNQNLDKAINLLKPIKEKYGDNLSWADLLVFVGNAAIKSMGGPVLGFCAGRTDDVNGADSINLGPSAEQKAIADCTVNGECEAPFGPTTIGLIYVNPEGHMGIPEPAGSVPDIRSSFERMGMNDRETVALIGGGHAFGKTHGACPTGPGTCGEGELKGKGRNTVTSGFEVIWTATPTKWTNDYFDNLVVYNWTKFMGPGGHWQWKPADTDIVDPADRKIGMLTADVALLKDPNYRSLVEEYAQNLTSLEHDFAKAWYKLMSRDMGPAPRCKGPLVPPPQPFQNPLPPRPAKVADFNSVAKDIEKILVAKSDAISGDGPDGNYYGALFVELAWRCASTFRVTDYFGGCNGARIRMSPEIDWPENTGIKQVLDVLKSVKEKYSDELSWADLIVLAGSHALNKAGSYKLPFTGGRVDATEGSSPPPRRYYPNTKIATRDTISVMGLTATQYIALAARPRSATHQSLLDLGSKTYTDMPMLSNTYFKTLLENKWEPTGVTSKTGAKQYRSESGLFVTDEDLALIWEPDFKDIVESFARDEDRFKEAFVDGWTTIMNADLF